MLNTDSKGFLIENLSDLNREVQPSIPKDFPKDQIPNELCGHALAQLYLCTMNSSTNLCGLQTKQYYICRRERDAQLFQSIKDWELNQFNKLKTCDQKQEYISDLTKEKERISQEYSKMNNSIANKHKKWRYQSDVQQLEHRLQYLNNSLN